MKFMNNVIIMTQQQATIFKEMPLIFDKLEKDELFSTITQGIKNLLEKEIVNTYHGNLNRIK